MHSVARAVSTGGEDLAHRWSLESHTEAENTGGATSDPHRYSVGSREGTDSCKDSVMKGWAALTVEEHLRV